MSLSARRAWIEIYKHRINHKEKKVALRKESVDRNIQAMAHLTARLVALRKESVDRNISGSNRAVNIIQVALRKESVDRNRLFLTSAFPSPVALRKESVDRNDAICANHHKRRVALRKESVDRNGVHYDNYNLHCVVALRKESVDRNLYYGDDLTFSDGSLSARRAWIEI